MCEYTNLSVYGNEYVEEYAPNIALRRHSQLVERADASEVVAEGAKSFRGCEAVHDRYRAQV